jgi:hypothetical protein
MVNEMPPLNSDGLEWWPFESSIYFYSYKDGNAVIYLISAPRAFVESAHSINLLLPGWAGVPFRQPASGCYIHGCLMKRPAI